MNWERQRTYDYENGKEAGLAEGVAKGEQQKAIESAKTMLADELSPDKVSLYSGLPLEQVLELQKQITVQA